ncbi:MAG: flagellar hook assembly protein FlgD [Solibacillus sp.]
MPNSVSKDITNDFYLPANDPNFKVTDKAANGELGKDAFLKILITQLQNQDPTSPMDDKEFIAQMAQFSSLEQMQNMTKAMENLLVSQQQSQMMSYSSFIGKEVKWHELTDKLDENKKPIFNEGTGVIKELKFVDGDVVFVLADGKEITPGNISSILGSGATTPSNPMAEASELIGKNIQYKKDDQVIDAIIEAITVKNGIVEYILNDGTRLKRDDFTLVEQEVDTPDKEDTTDKEPSNDIQPDEPTV